MTPAGTTTYTYDPLGRRVSKTVGSTTTRFLYDGDQGSAETDATGTMTVKYVYGAGLDEPLKLVRGGTTRYYHSDGLGSIVALTDSTGAITERYHYDVYGQAQITDAAGTPRPSSAVGNRYLFTGRELDTETGLYYHRARYYNSAVGRFLQRDPVGYSAGLNLFAYDNNPVNWVDPWGLEKKRGGYPNDPRSGIPGQNGGEFYLAIGIGGTIGGSLAPFILPSAFVGSAANVRITSTGRLFVQVQASGLAEMGHLC